MILHASSAGRRPTSDMTKRKGVFRVSWRGTPKATSFFSARTHGASSRSLNGLCYGNWSSFPHVVMRSRGNISSSTTVPDVRARRPALKVFITVDVELRRDPGMDTSESSRTRSADTSWAKRHAAVSACRFSFRWRRITAFGSCSSSSPFSPASSALLLSPKSCT